MGFFTEHLDLATQERAITTWARAHKRRLVVIARDSLEGENVETFVGLAEAMAHVRDGRARGVVVARLDRLAPGVIFQEQIIADVRRLRADVYSATAAEEPELATPPADPTRALVRAVIASAGEYEGVMRTLRARYRMARDTADDDREGAALARIEEMSEHGESLRDVRRAVFGSARSHEGFRRLVDRFTGDRDE